jgi:hypothetical protein
MARKDKEKAEAEATEVMDKDTGNPGADSAEEESFISDEEQMGLAGLDTDFDLEDEYKTEPLVPGGNYRGNVIAVAYEPADHAVAFKVTLDGNGGVMSDGETAIDGWSGYRRVWLPKRGDENVMTKDGRQTKRQSKINMSKRFAENMKINMNTPKIIATAIANQDWVGIPVIVAIVLSEYQGVTRNQINNMVQAEEAIED